MNSRPTRLATLMCLAAGALAGGTALGAAADAPAAAPAAPEAGVWVAHKYAFQFMGFTTIYSCDGLSDKLRQLLIAAGARPDAKASGLCAQPYGRPDRLARANLTFYTLAPATTATTAGEGPGLGTWKAVALSNRSPQWLQDGDCELVEQFQKEVLPMFATRNLESRMTCVPHQVSPSSISLRFESFTGVPTTTTAPAPVAPAAPTVFAYPTQGQGADQVAKDKRECAAVAATQTGYDPAQPAAPGNAARADAYGTALAACLGGRGYSVK